MAKTAEEGAALPDDDGNGINKNNSAGEGALKLSDLIVNQKVFCVKKIGKIGNKVSNFVFFEKE